MKIIALFIDYENVHYGLVNQYRFKPEPSNLINLILTEVSKDGNILIKRAYADWEKPEFNGVQAALKKTGVEPAYALSKKTQHAGGKETTWKDSADAVLLLDALQTVFERNDIEEFVIVTGDRAALDLVHRLTSRGKKVKICALESALAQELSDSVGGEVISIEKLLGIEPVATKVSPIALTCPTSTEQDWEQIIIQVINLEKKLSFVGCSYLIKNQGFNQNILREGEIKEIWKIYKISNPNDLEHPTAALSLNKDNPLVIKAFSLSK